MIQKRKEKLFYVKQKLSGIVTIAIGMIIPVLIKDITFSIVAISLGMYLILTKKEGDVFWTVKAVRVTISINGISVSQEYGHYLPRRTA